MICSLPFSPSLLFAESLSPACRRANPCVDFTQPLLYVLQLLKGDHQIITMFWSTNGQKSALVLRISSACISFFVIFWSAQMAIFYWHYMHLEKPGEYWILHGFAPPANSVVTAEPWSEKSCWHWSLCQYQLLPQRESHLWCFSAASAKCCGIITDSTHNHK